jgi:CRISPR locus-related DNA-binding protein
MKAMISTIYSVDSIILAVTKESIDSLYLIVDENPNKEQTDAINKIKEMYSKIINVKEIKVPAYDVYKVVKKCISVIESIPVKPIVNITPSRKTQAIGLLYACFKRNQRIEKIIYMAEEKKELITLPLLDFELSESQQTILKNIEGGITIQKLTDKTDLSRAMTYRIVNTLKAKGLIEDTSEGLKVTESGKIGLL